MTAELRSDSSTINGTAGTSVVITKPAATANGDVLVAFVAEVGVGTITAPAGWTLIGTQDASTSVRLAAYRKVAASEGASWTWTLGASVRCWGWVGAYTGVDTSSPISASASDIQAAGTFFETTGLVSPIAGVGVGAVAAVRTASGSATTWTPNPEGTELDDSSTNGGAGTDLAADVVEVANSLGRPNGFDAVWIASQAQTAAVSWVVTLTPEYVPYDGDLLDPVVRFAWGADPDAEDPVDWDGLWVDESAYVLADSGVSITKGRSNEASAAAPARVVLTVDNRTGRFSPLLRSSANWPDVVLNTPVMIGVPYGVETPTTQRAVVFIDSFKPRWDASLNYAVVDIVASGRLRRTNQGNDPGLSALTQTILSLQATSGGVLSPVAYWPMEDEAGASSLANAVAGGPPASIAGAVTLAASAFLDGSGALPTLGAAGRVIGTPPVGASTLAWTALLAISIPSAPASTVQLMQIDTTGLTWLLELTAASVLHIRAYLVGASVLDNTVALTPADLYGRPQILQMSVTNAGVNADYQAYVWDVTSAASVSVTGTLAAQPPGAPVEGVVPYSALSGASIGHFAIFATADGTQPYVDEAIWAARGNTADLPFTRFARLCTLRGVPYDAESSLDGGDDATLTMGPQSAGWLTALREVEAVDHGLIHDGGRDGRLVFVTRGARENSSVVMTLGIDNSEIQPGLEPVLDDQRMRTDVTVQRSGGGSAQYVAEDESQGKYVDKVTVHTYDDALLYEIASWRAALSVPGVMRYPRIIINLRRTPDLVEQWLACRIGSRIRLDSLPSQHDPDPVDLLIEGYTETISVDRWTVALTASPARPYDISVAAEDSGDTDPSLGHADWDSCVLAEALDTTETGVDITTTPLMTTTADDFPFDIFIDAERMTVTACSGAGPTQTLTVTRSINGVVASHSNGATVELHPDFAFVPGL